MNEGQPKRNEPLERVAAATRLRGGVRSIPAAIAATLLVVLALVVVGRIGSDAPVPQPAVGATAAPPASSSSKSAPAASTVAGLPVLTVSDVLSQRREGGLRHATVAVGGWWSNASIPHSCAPPRGPTGDLEIYCHDGEWGITELDEPIMVISRFGEVTPPKGPHLTPWLDNDLALPLFTLPVINGQLYPPVPIVVVGHFDDPRATDCRPEARTLCADRLVVDSIPVFDPSVVPTPAPTPPPTPFPSPGPPGLFGPEKCAGDVDYSFVGWTTTAELQLPFEREGHVWAMVTAIPVVLGDWYSDGSRHGHRFRLWGRRICIDEEGDPFGGVTFGAVPGSTYRLWDDGKKEEASFP